MIGGYLDKASRLASSLLLEILEDFGLLRTVQIALSIR